VIQKMIAFLVLLLAWGLPVSAKTMYTSDITEISVRQGRDTSYPVIQTLKSNEQVNVLESANGWSKIQLPDGKEGWLVSSYLTDKAPAFASSPESEKKMDQMTFQLKTAGEENDRLKKETQDLKTQLDNNLKNLADRRHSSSQNPLESEEFKALKTKSENLAAEIKKKADRINELEQQLADSGKNPGEYKYYVYMFLAGAGVLILGMIIGSSTKRRRSSLL
jgi:SH3 domain protein